MLMEKKERIGKSQRKNSKSSSDKILDGEFNSRPKIALVLSGGGAKRSCTYWSSKNSRGV